MISIPFIAAHALAEHDGTDEHFKTQRQPHAGNANAKNDGQNVTDQNTAGKQRGNGNDAGIDHIAGGTKCGGDDVAVAAKALRHR